MALLISDKIDSLLKNLYRRIRYLPIPNSLGERDIEYSFIAANMPQGAGYALDFGSGSSYMSLLAARKGFMVTAVDLTPSQCLHTHPNLKFIQGDFLKLSFAKNQFDLIINCSTIEHMGIAGRYGVEKPSFNMDLEGMNALRSILRPGKVMLLTIPVGVDASILPCHRVYGKKRLPKLLQGWDIQKAEYWIKDRSNKWICSREEEALMQKSSQYYYGLGLFILQKPANEG